MKDVDLIQIFLTVSIALRLADYKVAGYWLAIASLLLTCWVLHGVVTSATRYKTEFRASLNDLDRYLTRLDNSADSKVDGKPKKEESKDTTH